ncbi:hypothetical protein A2V49_02235 [candidate division WWE3 bacterium RBG_19FT_COMBO_34_6]|uniref:Uncharacterized protein n=1 Tax=candidate division WWE3 bacterium RBG_19FT_COMBO_34_6 TaxID=1802612 RepID=A0A1F4UJG5_UNCKA|nr:MAG: hypothetical protein A2V49_02235 [candidate division WWE3 bacterium RBG_19FT_COMBO_34_6]
MHWIKTINYKIIFSIFIFSFIFLLTRVPRLGTDEVNPDAVNWHYRSEQFIVGLKTGQFEKTYQHYHPGITLMWIMGVPIEAYKQISETKIYNQYSFYTFHFIAKYSLISIQLILCIFVIFILNKIISFKKALFVMTFMILEPFFIGNSRLLHMDVLFTLLLFISLTLFYLYLSQNKIQWLILSAVFTSLTFLTRSIGIGVFVYLLFGGFLFLYIYKKRTKLKIINPVIFTGVFILVTFVIFPALWKSPISVISDIFSEGQRIGLENGHEQIFFGQKVYNPGFIFYPLVILLKLSPAVLIGVVIYAYYIMKLLFLKKERNSLFVKNRLIGFNSFLSIFYLGYFLVMSLSSKKIDRYMVTIFPLIIIFAVYGYFCIFSVVSKNIKKYLFLILFLIFGFFVVQPLILIFPYYFTYTSPLFGSSYRANRIIGQKSFGIGIFDVKDKLQQEYGQNIEVGFIDTKPIKSIYPNSLVNDIRIDGPSGYDVIVLGINEDFPENIRKSKLVFIKDSSIFINGLEYWRFYVKQNN